METSLNNGMCRCCASEGTFKNFSNTYHWMGQEEVYADMLKECFDISLTTSEPGEEGGICEVCITQLRNAANFKKQVQHTEEQFKRRLENKLFKSDVVKIEAAPLDEVNNSDNDNNLSDNFSELEFELPIKKETEEPKPKKRAAKPTTSRAKKPKLDDGEPSTKRKRRKAIVSEGTGDTYEEMEYVNLKSYTKMSRAVHKELMEKHHSNLTEILKNSNASLLRCRAGNAYICSYCPAKYPDAADLKAHTLQEHDGEYHLGVAQRKGIAEYLAKLDITDLCCKLCNSNVETLECFKEHLSDVHGLHIFTDINNHILPFKFHGEELKCCICSAVFDKFKILLEHMHSHYRNYVCNFCGAGFVNRSGLFRHSSTHEKDDD